ncbi:bag family molecular chaperone regulator 5 mitochondrial [Phtheirospermum japonicum]|uniref:Bag family molecular chaperone regulator 5 mitochondrial n=1 Tax=Phtheirospermum japonicum TaxID=374723 RepID=A0A830CS43_9LAMI|nr:bag family molecular chaperone regulator 5 mitochondrial [Phtheirospermum japonicum]
MENPIFRNGRRYQPQTPRYTVSHSPSFGGVPVYPFDPTQETHQTCRPVNRPPERNSGPKVVQIPVRFVGSEQMDRPGSALKIQKVFRGFLVRKCLKKIKDIKVQVDEVGDKLSKREVMELVRRDGRERLRMNESLMSLLFKLDSICGVDFGVRGCRKAVIRKAIALQEKIDAIVNGETVDDQEAGNGQIVSVETGDSNQISGDAIMDVEGDDGEVDIVDVGVDREVKVINCVGDDDVIHEDCDLVVKESSKQEKAKEGDDSIRNREMLERMMEDNAKMMSLMTQLCERNETQTRMINALTQRVEMLEKAFVCDSRLRKKKKNSKKAAASC